MRVFVTGATGFIGSAVVRELISSGHSVIGLARTGDKAAALVAGGAEPFIGSLDDIDAMKAAIDRADAVIHTAFDHDFSKYVANCESDRRVVEAFGGLLAGSGRPLVVTSGLSAADDARREPRLETDPLPSSVILPRAASEEAAAVAAGQGANVSVIRLPQVHDTARQGLVSYVIAMALEKGLSAYVGEGDQRWTAAHVSDVARLYRLVVEMAAPRAVYHAAVEEGIPVRAIAEAIGRRFDLPVASLTAQVAEEHFGWLARFVSMDAAASSAWTRETLGWAPTGSGLVADIERCAAPR